MKFDAASLIGRSDVSPSSSSSSFPPSSLLKLSIIPGRDLISRDNVAARTNVYTCAR